eukprot:82319-Chlamydomonas_euryale.AAC.1
MAQQRTVGYASIVSVCHHAAATQRGAGSLVKPLLAFQWRHVGDAVCAPPSHVASDVRAVAMLAADPPTARGSVLKRTT